MASSITLQPSEFNQPPMAAQPYNPRFDPLVAEPVGRGMAYAPTYWVATAGAPPEDDGPISADTDADVVIVGGGAS